MKPIYMAGPWYTAHEAAVVQRAILEQQYDQPYYFCEEFQRVFAEYHDRRFGIMTPNCTTAIHLLLTALGVSDGDEVIVPECTWIASAAPIRYLRAKPVFCDIEADTWCLDPEAVERSITPRTKAIIVVDLFGNMPRMREILAIGERHGIPVIEDSAEALGSTYEGTRAGKFGVGSVFSFHRTKTIATGEGGMLLVDDEALYERCMFLRDHGRKSGGPMYYNYAVTYKYMPFNVQAALGYAQFQRIDELVAKKRWILQQYRDKLADVPDIQLNDERPGVVNGVWITALVFGTRHRMTKDRALKELAALGLPTRPFFYPLSSLPAFEGCESVYRPRNPCAYDISARGINLPGALNLEEEQIDAVCAGIRTILGLND